MGLSSGSQLYWAKTISYLVYICQITWNVEDAGSQNHKTKWDQGTFLSLYATCITCSESGGSITTSEPHLELTATWLYTIKNVFWTFVRERQEMNLEKSILCCCLLMSILGGWAGYCHCITLCFVPLFDYHKTCTILNVWCSWPFTAYVHVCMHVNVHMHRVKCIYMYTSCYTYVMKWWIFWSPCITKSRNSYMGTDVGTYYDHIRSSTHAVTSDIHNAVNRLVNHPYKTAYPVNWLKEIQNIVIVPKPALHVFPHLLLWE